MAGTIAAMAMISDYTSCVVATWVAANAGPRVTGSKTVPEPKSPDCLLGPLLCLTAELASFARDETIDLVAPPSVIQSLHHNHSHSRVTLQPSSKTSYDVLGDNAGPSKPAAIKKHGLKTHSEDDFLALIGTRVAPGGPGAPRSTTRRARKWKRTPMRSRLAGSFSARLSVVYTDGRACSVGARASIP